MITKNVYQQWFGQVLVFLTIIYKLYDKHFVKHSKRSLHDLQQHMFVYVCNMRDNTWYNIITYIIFRIFVLRILICLEHATLDTFY